jgi:hypothetical protein
MPTTLDSGQRSPRKLLAGVVWRSDSRNRQGITLNEGDGSVPSPGRRALDDRQGWRRRVTRFSVATSLDRDLLMPIRPISRRLAAKTGF